MEFMFYILLVILAIVIWSAVSERNNKKLLTNQLKEQWGQIPDKEYSSEKMEYMLAFYNSIKDELRDVDAITWNDLDMDEIYALMNNTQSSIGEEYLYALLHKPCFDAEELAETQSSYQLFCR